MNENNRDRVRFFVESQFRSKYINKRVLYNNTRNAYWVIICYNFFAYQTYM